jgi:hypothetical protein
MCWLLCSKFMVVLPSAGILDRTESKSFVLLLKVVQAAIVWWGRRLFQKIFYLVIGISSV